MITQQRGHTLCIASKARTGLILAFVLGVIVAPLVTYSLQSQLEERAKRIDASIRRRLSRQWETEDETERQQKELKYIS